MEHTEEEFTTRFVPNYQDSSKVSVRSQMLTKHPWLSEFNIIDSEFPLAVVVYRNSDVETTNLFLKYVRYFALDTVIELQRTASKFNKLIQV